MRYLEVPCISKCNQILRSLEYLNPSLSLFTEMYSCKKTRKQKKEEIFMKNKICTNYSPNQSLISENNTDKSLTFENNIPNNTPNNIPPTLPNNIPHTLPHTSSSKTSLLLSFTSIINLSFPEYGFHNFDESFFEKKNFSELKTSITNYITMSTKHSQITETIDIIFLNIDKDICFKDCIIYSLENRIAPYENTVWFFCYFLVNKSLKRILLMSGSQEKCK
ncbi:Maf1-like regulator protein [Hamiltosporidium magnivora]|uniref:Maf1-like regulator protein n=1 Tax=Hamiltosporidium magnivora TaxID=148818 RepID=A0A4Q9L403_9MICR|nr:Maf1-like regulator protein [Hamiltosporidium magnivora]